MFRHVAGFELKYQLRSPLFWGTILIFFLLAFVSVMADDIRLGWGGQVYRNAPYAVALACMIWTLFGMFIATAFVSSVVLRDDETGFGPIITATRLSKFDYLFGRFTGGFIASALAFLAVPLGALMAVLLPGPDPETIGPIRIGDYLHAYIFYCLPTLFLLGAGFFALATTTRSIVTTYVGALILLAAYFFLAFYLARPEVGPLATLIDPFGISAFNTVTETWTAHDRNSMMPPLAGLLLANRLLWILIGFAFLVVAWRAYSRKVLAGRVDPRAARGEEKGEETESIALAAPAPSDRKLGWSPLAALTRFELLGVLRSPVFMVLLGFAFINTIVLLWLAGDDNVTTIFPVTRIMIQTLHEQFLTIPLFIAAFYAGELVWRDRERRVHEIVDATPSPDWAFLVPKIAAIAALLLAMGLMSIAAAVAVQLLKGYTNLEFGHYLTWYLAPWFLTMVMYAVLAVFVQTLVPHKFVGLLIILLYYVLQQALPTMGFESHLYIYATHSAVPLSDMNGLGDYAANAAWYRAYWTAGATILAMLAWGLWRRGASAPLKVRLRMLPSRLAGIPGIVTGVAAIIMAGLGGWIYYNNYVLNAFPTYNESQRWAADYEKILLPFEDDPQPKIVDVKMAIDLYPDAPRANISGTYVIENKTDKPLRQVYVQWQKAAVQKIFLGTILLPELQMQRLDVPGARLTRDFPKFNFRIYTFDTPMAPGDRRTIRFAALREQKGFRNSGNEDRIVHNGTFLDNFSITPNLGVSRFPLVKDRATRRKYGLDPDLALTKLEDEKGRAFNYFRHDSDYVNADITITGPADQTQLAPGRMLSSRVEGNRRISHFRSEAPIFNFYSIQSAKYAVRKDRENGVDFEIYYHPAHTYNVERYLQLMKDSVRYYAANFSPYQFKQLRIIEFPAYNNFAQAFPGAVPNSEAAGFVLKIDDKDGVDFIAYIAAHEIGHQWWGHQVNGGDMQGSTVLTETLAQYSSIMVMEKRHGDAMIRRFLKRGLEGYLTARGKENVAEPSLERVEDQAYVRYDKGGNVMYLLKERMGEQAVNGALRALIAQFGQKGPPYATSRHLIAALRARAKPEHQQLITDLFQHITLYDLKVDGARATRRPDGRWTVTMNVEAHKRYSDGKGIETEAKLDELIDIGLFTADPGGKGFDKANVLSLKARRIRSGRQTLTLVVDREPKYVGVDPYLKYIDRNWEDNVKAVGGS